MDQFQPEQKGLFTFYQQQCDLQQPCRFGRPSKQRMSTLSQQIDSYGIPSRLYPPQSILTKSTDKKPLKPVILMPSKAMDTHPHTDLNHPKRKTKVKPQNPTLIAEKTDSNREMKRIIERIGNKIGNSDVTLNRGYLREKHNSKKLNVCRIIPMEPIQFKTIVLRETNELPTDRLKVTPRRKRRSKHKVNMRSEIQAQTSNCTKPNDFFHLPSIRKSVKLIPNPQFSLSGEKKSLKQSNHHRSIQQIVKQMPQQIFKSEIMDTISKIPLVRNHLNFKYLERSKEGGVVEVESKRNEKLLQILRQFQLS